MKLILLPFVLALGLVELLFRAIAVLILIIGTLTFALIFIGSDSRGPEYLRDFLNPACFDIAKKMVE